MAKPRIQGQNLSQFNEQLRADPEYRAFLRSMGVNPDAPVKLSGSQRSQAEQWVRQRYQGVGKNLQIDPAGNVNTDHGLSTAWSNPYFRYPLIAGAALGTAGAAGVLGGGGSAVGGASGLLPSYGPTAAMIKAGSTLPSIAASGTGAGLLSSYGPSAAMIQAGSRLPGAAAGVLSSRGPTAAMIAAGSRLPSVTQRRPADFLSYGADAADVVNRGRGVADVARNARGLVDEINPWLQAAIAGLAGLPALLAAKQGPSDEEKRLYEQARQMAELQQRRTQYQNPLFSAVTQLAMNRLPTNVQAPLGEAV